MKSLKQGFNIVGSQPLFTSGDLDGFFGLAIDNLIQYLLIIILGTGVLGFSPSLIMSRILPAAALSILVGNLFYAWQAQKLSAETGRTDVTALPYGINTVSMFAYVFLVMLPVKIAGEKKGMSSYDASLLAWQIGLAATFISGLIEFAGAFVAEHIRKFTPRAALLSTLSGIAISFIAIDFAIQTFETPLIAFLPLAIILTSYFSGIKFPFGIPGGALAVLLGTSVAWLFYAFGISTPVNPHNIIVAKGQVGFHIPVPVIGDMINGLKNPLAYQFLVPVMLPMGLFNVLGSLQNIESAEAAGDSYKTMPSLAVNGLGSMVAALFGSCYPTTIYIGHPGWKALGAKAGYSILNGVFFTIVALFGLSSLIASVIPVEAGIAIVLWIGITITAQAFQATPSKHAPAVSIGLFPAIASWGLLIVTQTLKAVGIASGNMKTAAETLANPAAFGMAGLHLHGLVAISQGFMITCLIWASLSVHLIERRFDKAAIWAITGAVLAFFGFMHAGSVSISGGIYDIGWASGLKWSLGYFMVAVFLFLTYVWYEKTKQNQPDMNQNLH